MESVIKKVLSVVIRKRQNRKAKKKEVDSSCRWHKTEIKAVSDGGGGAERERWRGRMYVSNKQCERLKTSRWMRLRWKLHLNYNSTTEVNVFLKNKKNKIWKKKDPLLLCGFFHRMEDGPSYPPSRHAIIFHKQIGLALLFFRADIKKKQQETRQMLSQTNTISVVSSLFCNVSFQETIVMLFSPQNRG